MQLIIQITNGTALHQAFQQSLTKNTAAHVQHIHKTLLQSYTRSHSLGIEPHGTQHNDRTDDFDEFHFWLPHISTQSNGNKKKMLAENSCGFFRNNSLELGICVRYSAISN